MKFFQLVSAGLAALICSSRAAPTAPPAQPIVVPTALYTKFGGADMVEGRTYKATIKWPKPAAQDPNADIEAARVAVNAKHYAFAAVQVDKKIKPAFKQKPAEHHMDIKGYVWDLQLGVNGAAVMPPFMTIDAMRRSLEGGTEVTRVTTTTKTRRQIDDIGDAYIRAHPLFNAQTNNCKTFVDHMMEST